MSEIVLLKRKVRAISIPEGVVTDLLLNEEVIIVHSCGFDFTVNAKNKLFYLEGCYADALGKNVKKFPSDNLIIKLEDKIDSELLWDQLRTVYDPEIPVNIVDLGLVYDIAINHPEGLVKITMTLTSPGCGMASVIMKNVERRINLFNNVKRAVAILAFDPPWSSNMMSDEAKIELGLF